MGKTIKCLRCGKDAPPVAQERSDGRFEYEDYHCAVCSIILHQQTYGYVKITYYVGRPPDEIK